MKSPGEAFVGQKFTYGFELTKEGFEYHIGVNHIGHFYLTQLLDAEIRAAEAPRVISVSSAAERAAPPSGIQFDQWKTEGMFEAYEDGAAYGQSKLANLMFARELVKRMTASGASHVQAYSVHPGIIESELSRYMSDEMEKQKAASSKLAQLGNALIQKVFEQMMFTVRGGALNQLYCATQQIDPAYNGGYFVPVGTKAVPGHPMAMDDTLAAKLWEKTEEAIATALA
jgi:NAD(P)-dependent dehydrogenase (short-subunit alcohol dehydrogenase family)